MNGYETFARYYDRLTTDVDYKQMADFLENYLCPGGLVCDLGCGTGSLALLLAGRGYDVIGVDSSAEMLTAAQQKALSAGCAITFLCQPMEQLDLYGTVDLITCTLDGMNHLSGKEAVKAVFSRAFLFLNPGGLFVFDVNTMYKHREVLGDHVFVKQQDNLFCVWQNFAKENGRVDIELDFFEQDADGRYRRNTEYLTEQAYTDDEIKKMLTQSGFQMEDVYDGYTSNKPGEQTQRLVYITKKEGKPIG